MEEKRNNPEISVDLTDAAPAEPQTEQAPVVRRRSKKTDPVVTGLMFGVSFLCLCIIGVMVYWLTAFLM